MFYGLDDYTWFPMFLSLVVSWSFGSFPEGHVAAAEQSWKYLKPSLLCSQLMSACGNRQSLGKIRPQLPALLQPARKNTRRSFDKMYQPDFHRFSINPNLQNDKFAPHGESLTPKIPQVPHFNFWVKKSLTASLTCNPDNAQGVSCHFFQETETKGWTESDGFQVRNSERSHVQILLASKVSTATPPSLETDYRFDCLEFLKNGESLWIAGQTLWGQNSLGKYNSSDTRTQLPSSTPCKQGELKSEDTDFARDLLSNFAPAHHGINVNVGFDQHDLQHATHATIRTCKKMQMNTANMAQKMRWDLMHKVTQVVYPASTMDPQGAVQLRSRSSRSLENPPHPNLHKAPRSISMHLSVVSLSTAETFEVCTVPLCRFPQSELPTVANSIGPSVEHAVVHQESFGSLNGTANSISKGIEQPQGHHTPLCNLPLDSGSYLFYSHVILDHLCLVPGQVYLMEPFQRPGLLPQVLRFLPS